MQKHPLSMQTDSPAQSSGTPYWDTLNERALLFLPIARVKQYDKNPRRFNNPNYYKIKDSISKDGLNQPLVVSRRPDEVDFVVYKGGNTRLQAVKELFDETGDHRFRFVECSFIPWSGHESDAIIGHLQENEMRKSLCFIDKSVGIKAAVEYLQNESEDEELSIRQCHSKLIKKGYSLTLSSLSIMLYAADLVEPHLPSTACQSMGRRPIQNLRRMQKAVVSVCHEFKRTENEANELFKRVLNDYSESEWNEKIFRRSLETNLTATVKASIQDVSLRLDGYLNLSSEPLEESFEKIFPALKVFEQNQINKSAKAELEKVPGNSSENGSTANQSTHQPDQHLNNQSDDAKGAPALPNVAGENSTPRQPLSKGKTTRQGQSALEEKLAKLRIKAFKAASIIAKRYGFLNNSDTRNNIILNTDSWGIGYLVADYPPAGKLENPRTAATRDALWWLLMEFSDLQWAIECARPHTVKLIGNTDLIHFIKSGDSKTLIAHARKRMRCNVPHLGLFNLCLRQLDNEVWSHLLSLTEAYRCIHQLATDNNVHIFQAPKQMEKI